MKFSHDQSPPSRQNAPRESEEEIPDSVVDGSGRQMLLTAVRLVSGGELKTEAPPVSRVLVSAEQVQRCHDLDAGDLMNVSGEWNI